MATMTSELLAVLLSTSFTVCSRPGALSGLGRAAPSDVAQVIGDHAMIDLIRDLIPFLSQDLLTIEDVVARIGSIAHDPGVPMPIDLDPVDTGVRSARLSRYPDSGLPYVLAIEPKLNVRPTVAALKSVLGDYHQALTDRGRPIEVVFLPPTAGACWKVVVVAELVPNVVSLESAAVTRVALRRDPHHRENCA